MRIAPVILRQHPELDPQQREAVGHAVGPMLVIAGPGSGKTRSVALRAVNLLLTGQAAPEELALCTFGRAAAGELRQRFTASALSCGFTGNVSQVSVSTIHSLCHRILAPHAGLAGLRPGYSLLDERERHRLLRESFDGIPGPEWDPLYRRGWQDEERGASEAARYFDRICEEAIDPLDLARSDRPFLAALGRCCLRYRDLLLARNSVDFAHLQVWACRALQNPQAAVEAAAKFRHLMVDEFQDTSRIQMRILSRLAGPRRNIVVVGDDDQGIHRFRGASAASLLQFHRRFPGCRVVRLAANYRSHPAIIAACGPWMETAADWSPAREGDRPCRFPKELAAHAPETHPDYPAVIAVQGAGPQDESRRLAGLLWFLKRNRVISSFGQVALLLHSVKQKVSWTYLAGLEEAGIPSRCEPAGHVHAPAGDEVLITTIHQAKGREWPVVVVGSLNSGGPETDRTGRTLEEFCGPHDFEPADRAEAFDRARRHYVAFSRPQNLLALTCDGQPHERFRDIWDKAALWPNVDQDALARQRFSPADADPAHTRANTAHLNRLVVNIRPLHRAT